MGQGKTALLMIILVSFGLISTVLSCNRRSPRRGRDEISTTTTMKPSFQLQPHIIGGFATSPNEFPFMVSIQYQGTHICGGSLLSEWVILTAAHCFQDIPGLEELTVVAGKHYIHLNEPQAQTRRVQEKLDHEHFNLKYPYVFDLTLLHVDEAFELNTQVQPIQLLRWMEAEEGSGVIIGWGLIREEDVELPDVLQKATVDILPQSVCQHTIRTNCPSGTGCPTYEPEFMLCAANSDLSGGKDACQYDSGGPLVINRGDTPYLAGIISWGIGCGRKGLPGVYSRISRLIE